ncbi:MAG: hypothetical protein ABIH49_02235 [archaeon]
MKDVIKYSLINSLGTAIYIVIAASFIYFLGNRFSGDTKTIFAPIAMLMLFVFSAALTGFLVFGRPIMWYLDGKKQKALSLLFYTLGIFLAIIIIVFAFLIFISGF